MLGHDHESFHPVPLGRLPRVRVWRVRLRRVPVRWPTTLVAALGLHLRSHAEAHPFLHPLALAAAHAARQGHQHVVGGVARIVNPAELRHVQPDAVVLQDRGNLGELRAVPAALTLPHHQCIPAACRVLQGRHQPCRLDPAPPREAAGLPNVEELFDDLRVGRGHGKQVRGGAELPGPRRDRVLRILSRAAAIEGQSGRHPRRRYGDNRCVKLRPRVAHDASSPLRQAAELQQPPAPRPTMPEPRAGSPAARRPAGREHRTLRSGRAQPSESGDC